MKEYKFTVPGGPKGKQRHRTTSNGRTFTPSQTVNYENLVIMCFKQKYHDAPPLTGELCFNMVSYFPIPKSTSKKKHAEMLARKIRPTKKPDFDNMLKIASDALNKIAFDDDKQVVESHYYAYYSDRARTEITIKEISAEESSSDQEEIKFL